MESDYQISSDPEKNTAGIAAMEVLNMLGESSGVELTIHKGLPPGSGLGSSAASAAAGAFATNYLYGAPLEKEDLILPATKAEEYVSGSFFADNTAPSLLGGATLTRSSLPLDIRKIGYIDKLTLIVVTPEVIILTRDARDVLPEKVEMEAFVHNMANACLIAAAFAKNDYNLFARSLSDKAIEPYRAKLIPGFELVKENAIKAGADGMAISGSGPTVFAVTDKGKRKAILIEDAMVRSFKEVGIVANSWITEVDKEGTRLVEQA